MSHNIKVIYDGEKSKSVAFKGDKILVVYDKCKSQSMPLIEQINMGDKL